MGVTLVLIISALLQFASAFLALRLMRITGRRTVWVLIAAAVSLMAVRRCITLFQLISGNISYPPDLSAELVMLAISVFMVIGIAWIAPLFLSIRQAEEALSKVNRVLKTISECNQALVRATNERDLLHKICQIIVEAGGYRLAWVGFTEQGEDKTVRPVAQAEYEEGYLDTVSIILADTERGRGPTGTAIRTGKPSVAKNLLTDPNYAPWRTEATKRGYASSIALPLIISGQTLGVLNIYAVEPDAFDKKEVKLLKELADNLAYGIVVVRTRAEHKKAEEELRKSEEKFRSLVESFPDNVAFLDLDGKILFTNRVVTGLTLERVVGTSLFDYIPANHREPLRRAMKNVLHTGETDTYEISISSPKGIVWWSNRIAAVKRAEKAIGFVVIGTDITERKQVEEEKEKIQTELRQAQKMEAIGQLTGGIAHDFNNILTAIQGYTNLALTEIQEDNPLYQDIKEIQKASMRAANLTRQLLLFSCRQPMEYTPLDPNKVINDLIKVLNRLIGEDISLITDLVSDFWMVNGDLGAIELVVVNLVVNARDAMPKGGEITIKTENVYIDEEYCKTYKYARPGRFVCLSVRDTGVGIDQSIIDRIFEPFFTTKEVGKATGMGLSVVYGIVKQHEGWVNVESSPGKGSIFRIYLPGFSGEPKEEQKESISLEEFRGKGERILLVEDEELIKEFTKKVLFKNGYVVFTATNVQEALDIFQKEKGNFDLIFSDIVLPNGRGPELLEEILKLKPKISVLFTSGYSDEKSDWSAIRKGDYSYLQKPYSLSDLLRVVRDALKIKGA